MSLNLYTEKGVIKRVKWSNMICEENPEFDYLYLKQESDYKNIQSKREVLDYNIAYFCELEILKSKWLNLHGNLTDHDLIMNKLITLFEPSFKINNVWFDDIGYLVFKIHLTAQKKSIVPSYLELGILIEIKGENEQLSNEVKKNFLVYDRKNDLQLRVNDTLIFYLSKNK